MVKPDIADEQISRVRVDSGATEGGQIEVRDGGLVPVARPADGEEQSSEAGARPSEESEGRKLPTRYHGRAVLSPTRAGRDASKIAEEVIAHLAGLPAAEVDVTMEITARIPDGAPDGIVRTVTENSHTLKFRHFGFERS